jgi:hypothetical protein
VTYSGDANYSPAGPVSESFTIKAAAIAPSKATLTRATATAQSCSATTFAVIVTSSTKAAPTGKVQLMNGTRVLVTGTLINGKVTLKAGLPGASTVTLHAHYLGDVHHSATNSTALKVTTSSTLPCLVK